MKYRTIGRTACEVVEFSLGRWTVGGLKSLLTSATRNRSPASVDAIREPLL